MLSSQPPPRQARERVELLVVGALTIDRFPDGTATAGGSVLHAARAAARTRALISVVTAAGDEPEARNAVAELRRLGHVILQEVPHSLMFEHDEREGRRHLRLEGTVRLRPDPRQLQRVRPRAILLAPVAGELDAAALSSIDEAVEARIRVAALQGWLRRREPDGRITPADLGDLPHAVLAVLRNCDVLVVSHEDLGREEAAPDAAAVADVRRWLQGPGVVVTWGGAGYVLADAEGREPAVVRRRAAIQGVPTVGAGDAFTAVLTVQLAAGANLAAAARAAAAAVERSLRRRLGVARPPLPT
jgi:sugar/nucleoside kinase (ribokinase family)